MPYVIYDEAVQPLEQPNEDFVGYKARVFVDKQGHISNTKNSIFHRDSGELPGENIVVN